MKGLLFCFLYSQERKKKKKKKWLSVALTSFYQAHNVSYRKKEHKIHNSGFNMKWKILSKVTTIIHREMENILHEQLTGSLFKAIRLLRCSNWAYEKAKFTTVVDVSPFWILIQSMTLYSLYMQLSWSYLPLTRLYFLRK